MLSGIRQRGQSWTCSDELLVVFERRIGTEGGRVARESTLGGGAQRGGRRRFGRDLLPTLHQRGKHAHQSSVLGLGRLGRRGEQVRKRRGRVLQLSEQACNLSKIVYRAWWRGCRFGGLREQGLSQQRVGVLSWLADAAKKLLEHQLLTLLGDLFNFALQEVVLLYLFVQHERDVIQL